MKKINLVLVLALLSVFFNISNSYSQYPSVYDLRTLGLMTAVKDQGVICGSCWAFASCAAIESQWLKLGYGTYDLSEDNIIDCHGFDEAPCAGGSYYMTQALLSYQLGILSEINDPYSPSLQDCPFNLTFPPQPEAFVEDMLFIPSVLNDIKQAIMDYGAVATTMFFNMANYNSSSYKYYDQIIDSNDSLYAHCVTIAGWNDTMVFSGAPLPGGWIIKDSYGSSWAQNGYFYCSYYDAGILGDNVVFPVKYDIPESQNRPHMYSLDRLGWIDNYGFASNNAWGLIKYTLQPSGGVILPQQIKRIGTWAVEDNTTISFQLWRNKSGNTLSGLIDSQTIVCPFKGYYTVPLNLPVDTLGSVIYIEMHYSCPAGVQSPIPVEQYETGHSSGVSLSSGSCWVSQDGNIWNPVGSGTSALFDLCIKMYTEDAQIAVMGGIQDSICQGLPLMLNDLSSLPKDSSKWYVNQQFVSSAPSFLHQFDIAGNNEVMLVVWLGNNSDTAISQVYVVEQPAIPTITQIGNILHSSPASAYQWLDETLSPVPGAQSQTFSPLSEGYYSVSVFNDFGCQNTSVPYDFHFAEVSEFDRQDLKMYPVPAQDVIYLEIPSTWSVSTVKVFDLCGNMIFMTEYRFPDSHVLMLDVCVLKQGIYWIELSGPENFSVIKKFSVM